MTASNEPYLCVGFSRYTGSLPSLGEPIFSTKESDVFFIQQIDEVSGKISAFVPCGIEYDELVVVTSSVRAAVDGDQVYCLEFSDKPAIIAPISISKPYFQSLAADAKCPLGLKMQIAEILGSIELRRKSKDAFDHVISTRLPKSGIAYHRSIARVSLWRRLMSAAASQQVKDNLVLTRSFADVDIDNTGSVSVSLDRLDPADFPSLKFSSLGTEIYNEIGPFDVAHNDNSGAESNSAESDINPISVKNFLNKYVGQDGRITSTSYSRTSRLLDKLGFYSIEQVHRAVEEYDGLQLGYIVYGNRQGQITKFELMLLAALGEHFVENNLLSRYIYYRELWRGRLSRIRESGTKTGLFDPRADTAEWRRPHSGSDEESGYQSKLL